MRRIVSWPVKVSSPNTSSRQVAVFRSLCKFPLCGMWPNVTVLSTTSPGLPVECASKYTQIHPSTAMLQMCRSGLVSLFTQLRYANRLGYVGSNERWKTNGKYVWGSMGICWKNWRKHEIRTMDHPNMKQDIAMLTVLGCSNWKQTQKEPTLIGTLKRL